MKGGVTAPDRMCFVNESDNHDPGELPPPDKPHGLKTGECLKRMKSIDISVRQAIAGQSRWCAAQLYIKIKISM